MLNEGMRLILSETLLYLCKSSAGSKEAEYHHGGLQVSAFLVKDGGLDEECVAVALFELADAAKGGKLKVRCYEDASKYVYYACLTGDLDEAIERAEEEILCGGENEDC